MAARQTLVSRITELEKEDIYKQYHTRVGELILGEIGQIMKRICLLLTMQLPTNCFYQEQN